MMLVWNLKGDQLYLIQFFSFRNIYERVMSLLECLLKMTFFAISKLRFSQGASDCTWCAKKLDLLHFNFFSKYV